MKNRETPIAISSQKFKEIGYQLIDDISEFIENIDKKPVTKGETSTQLQQVIGQDSFPQEGESAESLIKKTTNLLFEHSLFNGHPKFFGYITSSPAPIGALADLLAATVNSNVGAQILSPIATEIEKQTVQWLAEFIGLSSTYGGILVSGGNMANFTAFLAARTAKAPKSIKENGLNNESSKLLIYCSKTTHTWVEKAAILFGHGSKSVRWIATDASNKMDITILEETIATDKKNGFSPFMIVGTAGDVSTGTVDDLSAIATVCKKNNLWFHIDGAYGAPAAIIPELKTLFSGIEDADSVALDPHKWLYSPLEAGCTLVKNPKHLTDTYSSHPEYYNFSAQNDNALNYYEHGLQNSRGFRALKVWLALQQVGKNGYIKMIKTDIELAKLLFQLAMGHDSLEAVSQNLSITTFRYIPENFSGNESYLNILNEKLDNQLQAGGEVFVSNAIIEDRYCLRACIVNFRTTKKDIEETITIIVNQGIKLHIQLQEKMI